MRLGALFLTSAALMAAPPAAPAAQRRHVLPWEGVPPLAWQAESWLPPSAVPGPPVPSQGPMAVHLTGDGTLRISDARGLIRLLAGLPGRPLRAWRDGGVPLDPVVGAWGFPTDSPLSQGLGGLHWSAGDFRPFLRGLLWVLEDGEGFLTVVHPATARMIHLPLPQGRDLRIRFLPDRLEVAAGDVEKGAPRQWSTPWMGLLPRLAALGPHPDSPKSGTALAPFPKD
ncbi:MAG TPA: hypothetical protein VFV26_03320 [Geothrix sp.]|nr:hypothetical protein [Geothrix sp.]